MLPVPIILSFTNIAARTGNNKNTIFNEICKSMKPNLSH